MHGSRYGGIPVGQCPVEVSPGNIAYYTFSTPAKGAQLTGTSFVPSRGTTRSLREHSMNDESTPGAFKTTDPATLAPGKSYRGHSSAQAAAKATRAAEAQR